MARAREEQCPASRTGIRSRPGQLRVRRFTTRNGQKQRTKRGARFLAAFFLRLVRVLAERRDLRPERGPLRERRPEDERRRGAGFLGLRLAMRGGGRGADQGPLRRG